MLYLVWSVAIVVVLALYFRQSYSRLSRYGVKHFPTLPILGNVGRLMFGIDNFVDDINRHYNSFPNERYVGKYVFTKPAIFVRDLELLKKITIKDFEHFVDHQGFVDEKVDPFFGRNLFSLKGQEWKDMRSTLSPAFTSSKIGSMVPFMVEAGNEMIHSLTANIKDSGVDYIDIDSKDLTTRYANDVIATCAFGLKVNSHVDKENEFYQRGKEASSFTFNQLIKLLAFITFPKLVSKLNFTFFPEKMSLFFKNVVLSTMADREKNNIIRPDMIHLLMEAKKGKLMHEEKTAQDADAGFATVEESSIGRKDVDRVWSDNDLIAQAVLFYFAGFETVSTSMSFTLHELALNPDVQEKLAKEIKENDIKNNGKFTYKSIQSMTYMDMVVSEVLRLWPPAPALDRKCIKDYNLGRANNEAKEDYIIRKGENMGVPTWAIHRDPQYFPDPLKFDPERFSDENKHKIHPFSYMPFGVGPRNCIGSRFALCEVKIMLYQLLLNFEVTPCEKTCIPTKIENKGLISIRIKGGHWIRLKRRT